MGKKGKVIGIGGIFFKCNNPDQTKKWYADHLNMQTDQWGQAFKFRLENDPDTIHYLQWSPFPADTQYFEPSAQPFMINYRVENIEDLVEQLKEKGVTICDDIETYEYGKFVHIMDADGNKIELWEPTPNAFE